MSSKLDLNYYQAKSSQLEDAVVRQQVEIDQLKAELDQMKADLRDALEMFEEWELPDVVRRIIDGAVERDRRPVNWKGNDMVGHCKRCGERYSHTLIDGLDPGCKIAPLEAEIDRLQARVAELERERDDYKRKGEELCAQYGHSPVKIHDLEAERDEANALLREWYGGMAAAEIGPGLVKATYAHLSGQPVAPDKDAPEGSPEYEAWYVQNAKRLSPELAKIAPEPDEKED